jgi:hypothetical protein
MPITQEMQKLIKRMEYSPDGNWDKKMYLFLKHCYYKGKLSESQIYYLCDLDDQRRSLIFEYIRMYMRMVKNVIFFLVGSRVVGT